MTRRFGDRPESSRKYHLRAGVYAVLVRAGNVLLTQQLYPRSEFQLPGGGIDPGETPLRALHREVLEETGWRIAPQRRLGAFRRFTFMPEYDLWAEKLCHVYAARPVRQIEPPREPGHRAVWMLADRASDELANPGDAYFVRDLLAQARSRNTT